MIALRMTVRVPLHMHELPMRFASGPITYSDWASYVAVIAVNEMRIAPSHINEET